MAQTVKIPSDRGNPVHVKLNGKEYVYPAGETVSVPNEVAALFEANAVNDVQYGRHASAHLEAPADYTGANAVPVQVDPNGRLFAPAAAAAPITVQDHVVVVAETTGG